MSALPFKAVADPGVGAGDPGWEPGIRGGSGGPTLDNKK